MTRDDPRLDSILSPRQSRSRVLDTVADLAHDAVEFGDVDADAVASALEEAAEEVRERDHREPPTRSEPADFGGGESTGVQDL